MTRGRGIALTVIVALRGLAGAVSGATSALGGETAVQTPSIFAPTSTPAFAIRDLSWFVLGICAVIFVVVGGLLTYSVIRFRRRPGEDDREPPQVYGSNQIELALIGAVGWWQEVLPQERVEHVSLRPPAERARPVVPSPAAVEHLRVGEGGHRVRVPVEIQPYSSGVKGGIVGGEP
jgi:hypothetical protein